MGVPFTADQFFEVFARYNEQVWPAQILLNLLALAAVLVAWRWRGASRAVAVMLAALWLWAGVVYHWIFFRQVNPAASVFAVGFVLQALLILWLGTIRTRLVFAYPSGMAGAAGWMLVGFALVIYPVLGYLFGHHYPSAPTFGAPCPLTIFTFGLLLWAARPVPWAVLIVPVVWALVGTSAALTFGVWQDLGLPVAALVTVGLLLAASRRDRREPAQSGTTFGHGE